MAERKRKPKPKPAPKPAPPAEDALTSIEVACAPGTDTPVHLVIGLDDQRVRIFMNLQEAQHLNRTIALAMIEAVKALQPAKPKLILPN